MAQRLRARLFVARSSQISSGYAPRSRLDPDPHPQRTGPGTSAARYLGPISGPPRGFRRWRRGCGPVTSCFSFSITSTRVGRCLPLLPRDPGTGPEAAGFRQGVSGGGVRL